MFRKGPATYIAPIITDRIDSKPIAYTPSTPCKAVQRPAYVPPFAPMKKCPFITYEQIGDPKPIAPVVPLTNKNKREKKRLAAIAREQAENDARVEAARRRRQEEEEAAAELEAEHNRAVQAALEVEHDLPEPAQDEHEPIVVDLTTPDGRFWYNIEQFRWDADRPADANEVVRGIENRAEFVDCYRKYERELAQMLAHHGVVPENFGINEKKMKQFMSHMIAQGRDVYFTIMGEVEFAVMTIQAGQCRDFLKVIAALG